MSTKSRWIWLVLFFLALGIAGGLATSWNLVLVRDYNKIIDLARQYEANKLAAHQAERPLLGITLGSLGFLTLIVSLVAFYIRMQKESRLSEQQRNFLSRISHELKTPISTLELTSDLLKQNPKPQATTELWKAHDQELRRLKEQVSLLLESARIQSEAPRAQIVSVDLKSFVECNILRWKRRLGSDWDIRVTLPDQLLMASVDERLLELIFDNFMDNAVKFSLQQRTLYVRLSSSASKWTLEIQDLGVGFSSLDQKNIFKRFYRGKSQDEIAIPGNGLGLFLAQTSARSMGLRILAESAGIGKGATFRVSS